MEEMAKRKQPEQVGDDEDGVAGGRSGEEEHREITDEEVEEFFSFLRRLHAASKSFAGGGGRRDKRRKKKGRREEEEAKAAARWRPRFTLEDFEAIGDGGGVASDGAVTGCRSAAEDPIPRDLDLDLNAELVDEDRDW
ncbi:hypothetical protein OPV22_012519 [Ensete ventricosum]|uniref:Protein NEGATIVE REGULATOR OF RESISTANCE n=1 Tax=Ensete ventricosum TaxID=4639 RepID=A0AAV8R576_ENSVE|nr:hypothetical protein OPV22_012519 [Ensete ventricosum]